MDAYCLTVEDLSFDDDSFIFDPLSVDVVVNRDAEVSYFYGKFDSEDPVDVNGRAEAVNVPDSVQVVENIIPDNSKKKRSPRGKTASNGAQKVTKPRKRKNLSVEEAAVPHQDLDITGELSNQSSQLFDAELEDWFGDIGLHHDIELSHMSNEDWAMTHQMLHRLLSEPDATHPDSNEFDSISEFISKYGRQKPYSRSLSFLPKSIAVISSLAESPAAVDKNWYVKRFHAMCEEANKVAIAKEREDSIENSLMYTGTNEAKCTDDTEMKIDTTTEAVEVETKEKISVAPYVHVNCAESKEEMSVDSVNDLQGFVRPLDIKEPTTQEKLMWKQLKASYQPTETFVPSMSLSSSSGSELDDLYPELRNTPACGPPIQVVDWSQHEVSKSYYTREDLELEAQLWDNNSYDCLAPVYLYPPPQYQGLDKKSSGESSDSPHSKTSENATLVHTSTDPQASPVITDKIITVSRPSKQKMQNNNQKQPRPFASQPTCQMPYTQRSQYHEGQGSQAQHPQEQQQWQQHSPQFHPPHRQQSPHPYHHQQQEHQRPVAESTFRYVSKSERAALRAKERREKEEYLKEEKRLNKERKNNEKEIEKVKNKRCASDMINNNVTSKVRRPSHKRAASAPDIPSELHDPVAILITDSSSDSNGRLQHQISEFPQQHSHHQAGRMNGDNLSWENVYDGGCDDDMIYHTQNHSYNPYHDNGSKNYAAAAALDAFMPSSVDELYTEDHMDNVDSVYLHDIQMEDNLAMHREHEGRWDGWGEYGTSELNTGHNYGTYESPGVYASPDLSYSPNAHYQSDTKYI